MTDFGSKSTAQEVLQGVNLQGKRVLITGVSSGLGVETARALAAQGADVIGAARDLRKATAATVGARGAAVASGGNFSLLELDLASLASVRTFAEKLNSEGKYFDFVIANAGVMATPYIKTVDNFETQFGTNHLGHFLLVNRISALIADNGRLVNLSSAGHRQSDVDLGDPNFEKTQYDPWVAYGRSKTANMLFAVEFDRRHRQRGVRACAVMPGVVHTELGRHMTQQQLDEIMAQMKKATEENGAPPLDFKTVEQGAATTVWAAAVADGGLVGGSYCENCNVSSVNDDPAIPFGVRSYALDEANAKKLWARSEELIGEAF